MPVQLPPPHDNAGIVVIVIIGSALCVRYWRIVVPLILIAALALTVLGLIEGLGAFFHALG